MSNPIRILYVDDNALDRALVRDALEREHGGFQVTEARSREEFESQLPAGDFELILSDFHILGYTGLQVIDAVHAQCPHVPVVIVTATGSEEIAVEAMKRGADDYVIKSPRHVQRLPQTIHSVMERRRLRDDHEQALNLLRASETLFHTLARCSPVGIIRTNTHGLCSYVNQRWSELTGVAPLNAIGRGWMEVVHPGDRDRIANQWLQCVDSGSPFQAEYRILRTDGQVTWVLGQGLPDVTEQGELYGYVCTTTDVTERNRDRRALDLQSRIIDQIHDAVTQVDLNGVVRSWNKGSERLLGYTREEMIGESIARVYPPEYQQSRQQLVVEPVLREGQHEVELEHLRKDGQRIWVHLSLSLLRDDKGKPVGTLCYAMDITERMRQEAELRLRQRALDASANGIMICMAEADDQPIIYVNHAFEVITGYPADEVIGKNCRFLQGEERAQSGLQKVRDAIRSRSECRVLLRNFRKNGEAFWNELHVAPVRDTEGRVTHFVGIQNDVTERVQQQNEIIYRANHDELTGLENRRVMRDALDASLSGAAVQQGSIGVVLLNIDKLHHINDTLGYAVGDQVLIEASRRLLQLAAASGCRVGRIAGDEFLLITNPNDFVGAVDSLAEEVSQTLAQPYIIDGQSLHLTCSVGVSWSPDAGNTATQLLGQADLALNLAKQRGRNQVVLFSADRAADLARRIEVGAELREALPRGELQLHYQPLVDAQSGLICGAEALMRWTHHRLGPIGPDRFIPIAEDTGMIVDLGDWALRSTVVQLRKWRMAGRRIIPLSVNVSAVQFQRPEFIEYIEHLLAQEHIDAGLLKIEITESVLMQDAAHAVPLLNRLKALGVSLSLDDFGTGYSSLGYLRRLPIDEIKIDKSFVSDVIDDPQAATLCRAILALSQQLGFTTVAEGVETGEQARFLRSAGCQLLQGFLFSKATPAERLDELIDENTCWPLAPSAAQAVT